MNTTLQTQAPNAVTTRASKKAANEMKTKSRTANARKKSILRVKNSAPKRKAAGKVRSSAKSASRKANHVPINDSPAERAAAAPQSGLSSTGLSIPDEPPEISEAALEQEAFWTADVSLEPVRFEDQIESPSDDMESIAAGELIEPDATPDSAPPPACIAVNEPAAPAELTALCEGDAALSEGPIPQVAQESAPPLINFCKAMRSQLTQVWNWVLEKFKSHQVRKRLRVCETVSLGEKRFLAVVQVDGEQFLVGGSSSSVSTLAHLERSRDFSDVFQRHCGQDFSQA